MSIPLNGRVVQVILRQNTGDSSDTGAELDISGYLVSLGDLSWTVDENLTKLSLGNLSLTLADDPAGTVWSFLEGSLSHAGGILPPWCYLSIDGTVVFIGIIRESPIRSLEATAESISLNVVAWSSMLEARRIAAGEASLDRRTTFRNGTASAAGADITGKSVVNKELRRGHDRTMVALPADQENNFSVGDWVYVHNYSTFTDFNKQYPIEGAQAINVGGIGNVWAIYLGGGFWWKENPGDVQNFGQTLTLNRVYQSTSVALNTDDLPVFVAAETWDSTTAGTVPKTSLVLSYTDGLLPGDKISKVTSAMIAGDSAYTLTIADVDPTAKTIYLDAPLSNSITSGITSFQVEAASLGESVNTQVIPLINKVMRDLGRVDTSSYQAAELPSPCFAFLPFDSPHTQNTHTETLADVSDIQATLTKFEVLGNGKAWSGLPTTGWDTASWTKKVSWVDQVATAPTYLMPYVALPTDALEDSKEDRGRTNYPGLDKSSTEKGTSAKPYYLEVYDYSNFRRYLFGFTPGMSLSVSTYSGTAWSTVSGFALPTTPPKMIVPLPGTTSSVGSGHGLVGLWKDGTARTMLSTVTLSASLPGDVLTSTGTLQAKLIQTANGLYYTTPGGYGTIRIVAGALEAKFRQLIDLTAARGTMRTITPISSLVYANGVILSLAKVSYKNNISDARFTEDTYLLQLEKDIVSSDASGIIYADFITGNIPRATMMIKSPISEDVFGFMGSRIFQIATRLPDCVERFTSTNQTPAAIIEFVAAMTNSVAIPRVNGVMKFYSRGFDSTPLNITVDVVSTTAARWNKHLADCVVIRGFDSCQGVAVSETQRAGLTISYSNEVYIRNSSQARAIAQSYLAFFEVPRHEVEQTWYSDTIPAPWEALDPMQIVTVNGGSQYYLTGLTVDHEHRTAKATLLEVI